MISWLAEVLWRLETKNAYLPRHSLAPRKSTKVVVVMKVMVMMTTVMEGDA